MYDKGTSPRVLEALKRTQSPVEDTVQTHSIGTVCLLTKRRFEILLDADGFSRVSMFSWRVVNTSTNCMYVKGYVKLDGALKAVYLHRYLTSASGNIEVDHRNCNTLDNRAENLRLCNRSQNQANKRIMSKMFPYKGIYKHRDRFGAAIRHGGRRHNLGRYATAEDAAKAYDEAALYFFGEFARLNFPKENIHG